MIIKKLPQIGNPVLREKSKPVKDFKSKEVQQTIQDLTDTIRDSSDLVAMAAPQLGRSLRIFITEIRKTEYRNPEQCSKLTIYINPEIIKLSKEETVGYEGCGSVLNCQLFAPVKRPKEVVVEAYDQNSKKFRLEVGGLLGRAIQHEYDHLEGILFTDKIHDWKKIMSSEEYIKMRSKTAKTS
ncbi:peptide deformylase [Patescibacteria group bacterium]|nr:peptide deformylase [Patescibacteria group bacterium]